MFRFGDRKGKGRLFSPDYHLLKHTRVICRQKVMLNMATLSGIVSHEHYYK